MTRIDIPQHLFYSVENEGKPTHKIIYNWITARIPGSEFKYGSEWCDHERIIRYYIEFQDAKFAMLFKLTWL